MRRLKANADKDEFGVENSLWHILLFCVKKCMKYLFLPKLMCPLMGENGETRRASTVRPMIMGLRRREGRGFAAAPYHDREQREGEGEMGA